MQDPVRKDVNGNTVLKWTFFHLVNEVGSVQ
jgi:hypothetical protein